MHDKFIATTYANRAVYPEYSMQTRNKLTLFGCANTRPGSKVVCLQEVWQRLSSENNNTSNVAPYIVAEPSYDFSVIKLLKMHS